MAFPPTTQPSPQPDPAQLVQAAHCGGHTWWVSPTQRTIYYLDSLSPAETAQAIMQAVEALQTYDSRPRPRLRLRLVHSIPKRAAS